MSEALFSLEIVNNMRILFIGVLLYAVIFALLKKIKVLGDDDRINSLIALMTALIVSFSGILTYTITYALNWFMVIFLVIFFFVIFLMFLGIKMDDISGVMKQAPWIWTAVGVFFVLFLGVVYQGFLDVNSLDREPFGLDENGEPIPQSATANDDSTFVGLDNELISAILFFVFLGLFVIIIGSAKD